MKFTVAGLGFVGLSSALLIAQKYEVIAIDIDENKIDSINNRVSPIDDEYIKNFLNNDNLNFEATLDKDYAYKEADFIIICAPTDFDDKKNSFDTSIIEEITKDIISINKNCSIVIKSTVPVGFTDNLKSKYNFENIFFSPEFLREGNALFDNLYPSRIIVGDDNKDAKNYVSVLKTCAIKEDINSLFVSNKEAEAIKLFSNTYLAMRVAFFNELDTFAEVKGLNSKDVINGLELDPRIGEGYSNPSFGYGGYCLPKDTKQLLTNFSGIDNKLIEAIVTSNKIRKDYIVKKVLDSKIKNLGIYRLSMKMGSENFRSSAILDIIDQLKNEDINILIYEPNIKEDIYKELKVHSNFETFVNDSDLILANRKDSKLEPFLHKTFSRDLFGTN